jgi:hypothetical protein
MERLERREADAVNRTKVSPSDSTCGTPSRFHRGADAALERVERDMRWQW